jgi:hypothetical protein
VEAYPKGAKTSVHLELFFASHRGFVLLDESDMPSWLKPDLVRSGHVAYEVKSGGWFDGIVEGDSFLQIASAQCREWLVVTSDECVSVFSSHEPTVRELSV